MRFLSVSLLSFLLVLPTYSAGTKKMKEISAQEYERAEEFVRPFYEVDSSIKKKLEQSVAYAVYPKVGKGAAGVGAAYGEGLVYEKSMFGLGYRLVGYSELVQVTLGLQLGGQTYGEIVFFETQKAFDEFKKGKLKLSAQASAVAASSGSSANVPYKNGIAIVTLKEKGLMGELSVGTQEFSFVPAKKK